MRLSNMIGAVLVSTTLYAAPVWAQPVEDQMRATARALADEGMSFYEQKKYAEALDRFDRAGTIIQAPTITLHAARSLEKLGRLIEAAERYRTCINTPLDDNGPQAFRDAQAAASNELQTLTPRIPSIEIVVQGPGAAEAVVTLDGKSVPKALIGVKTLVDPGDHKIGATTDTHADVEELAVSEKQAARVVLELEPKSDSNSGQTTDPDKLVKQPINGKKVGGFVALGVGGAFAIVGVAAGITALDTQTQLKDACPQATYPAGGECTLKGDPDFKKKYESFTTQSALATAGLVIGGAGIATGVVLLIVSAKSKPAPQPATTALHVEPLLGIGFAGVRGTF